MAANAWSFVSGLNDWPVLGFRPRPAICRSSLSRLSLGLRIWPIKSDGRNLQLCSVARKPLDRSNLLGDCYRTIKQLRRGRRCPSIEIGGWETDRMDKTVGIIGLGIMGGAIARNLIDRGWHVIGFDIVPARCAELAQANVTIAGDIAQLTRDAPIILTSLPTPKAVEDVAQAIANSGQRPRIVVELSTLSLADKLRFEEVLKQAGHIALDCPLSGTGAQAKARDLVVYASGDSTAIAQVHGSICRLRQAERRSRQIRQRQPDEIRRQPPGRDQ